MRRDEEVQRMATLIAKAELEGKWLHAGYQDLWFSPAALREQQAQGNFRWGVVNWKLRDPQERIEEARERVDRAQAEFERIVREVHYWQGIRESDR